MNSRVAASFGDFDPAAHEAEAEARWGGTTAWHESRRRTAAYSPADWDRFKAESQELTMAMAACMARGLPVQDREVQALVLRHRNQIDAWFYPCSRDMHHDLAAMYVADVRFMRNLDRIAAGFATYLSEAILAS